MLSKNKIKLIHSLAHKKIRTETGLFIAEGNKTVADMLPYFECELLLTRPCWLATQGDIKTKELIVAEDGEIEKASLLKNPQDVIAVFHQPALGELTAAFLKQEICLALDGIQDPGNLGTIVRIADWFGIERIICSKDTADIYNPKTIQATMGALARIQVYYTELPAFLRQASREVDFPVYGTFLEGENLYEQSLGSAGIIIMGNEGNGIRETLLPYISKKIRIPSYPAERETSESLNVAVATAVVCAEIRRQSR
ncbi:MAG: RNA methyltransferase [Dysgonamonadaceae bacterium]|jgi:TrmH family RNA methyltransferase|nr:RNA methyltransferase [Dysgonamonadaceae bacterium]